MKELKVFQAKPHSATKEIIGKCKKCGVEPPFEEINYARRKGRSPIQSELLGDNFNSPKEVLQK